jgi:hypothetical protein
MKSVCALFGHPFLVVMLVIMIAGILSALLECRTGGSCLALSWYGGCALSRRENQADPFVFLCQHLYVP